MISQVIAILALILGQEERFQPLALVGRIALWVVVGTALVSGYDYYRRFNQVPAKAVQAKGVETASLNTDGPERIRIRSAS
jgi:hypothetical protein